MMNGYMMLPACRLETPRPAQYLRPCEPSARPICMGSAVFAAMWAIGKPIGAAALVTGAVHPVPVDPTDCAVPEPWTNGSRRLRRACAYEKLPVTWTVNPGPSNSKSLYVQEGSRLVEPETPGQWFPYFAKCPSYSKSLYVQEGSRN